MISQSIIAIIPARYASSRFPGKVLAQIRGKTLIQHTYENAKKCPQLQKLIIATDDKRVYDHVTGFGATCIMTSPECADGTVRIAEVLRDHSELQETDLIVNIQGDEPCLNPNAITQVAKLLKDEPDAVMSTAVVPLANRDDALDPSVVKCVFDQNYFALYFSRSPIPALTHSQESIFGFQHVGLYCYKPEFLLQYPTLPETPLQKRERLEQLKVLEHGYRIKVVIIQDRSVGVDTPDDIDKVEKILCQ